MDTFFGRKVLTNFIKIYMIILEEGHIPCVDFSKNELYKITEKYIHLKISSSNLAYIPSYTLIKKSYLDHNHSLSYLIGAESHTDYAYELYKWHLEQLQPTEDEYYYFLKKVAKKLFYLKNSFHVVVDFFMKYLTRENPNIPYQLEEQEIYDVVNVAEMEHQKNPYKPKPKCVVFNPNKELNSTYKQIIQQKEIGKYNKNIVLEKSKTKTINEIITDTKLSKRCIINHLKVCEKTTIGNKKSQTIQSIQKCKKKNPKWTQKQVGEHLNISLRTIERYWNL